MDGQLEIRKPVPVWRKPLKADLRGLFSSLVKAVINRYAGDSEDAGEHLADAAAAIGISAGPGEVAWQLIKQSLGRALLALTRENLADFAERSIDRPGLDADLDRLLGEGEIDIDRAFFERPEAFPLLDTIRPIFSETLQQLGLERARADATSARLPAYFVFALNEVWREGGARWAVLQEAVQTPFTAATERQRQWSRYRAWLHRLPDTPMFHEAFGLRQVFVEPRAWFAGKDQDGEEATLERRGRHAAEGTRKREVVRLREALEAWLDRADVNDAVRVISGGPGSGKSSFAKMFAARQAERGQIPLLLVPLHRLSLGEDLSVAVGAFVANEGLLASNPLDPTEGEDRLLLILDGLDELSMQGRRASEAAAQLVQQVLARINQRNGQGRARLQVLLVGRELAVQGQEHLFRRPGQILHMVPYALTSAERALPWVDPRGLLKEDQRVVWWSRYSQVTGRADVGLPAAFAGDELIEVTGQPLLNYLVALASTRQDFVVTDNFNLNQLYAHLLRAVHERGWESERAHPGQGTLRLSSFHRVLEEIALSTWQGGGRTATVSEIEARCSSGVKALLEQFQLGAQEGVTRLLTAFYFRQQGVRGSEQTFEFTHKSFGEYLTACRLVRAIRQVDEELARRADDLDTGWDDRGALVFLVGSLGPAELDDAIIRFIDGELRLRPKEEVERWNQLLSRLFGHTLRHGTPVERLDPRPATYREEDRLARNTEVGLLVLMGRCAEVADCMSKVDWPGPTALGDWLYRVQGQRKDGTNGLALRHLFRLEGRQVLDFHDLYGANLRQTSVCAGGWVGAGCFGVTMEQADLEGANLEGARLARARLADANLEGANLEGANLEGANLEGANLEGANLVGAILEGANLERANLVGAILRGANLEGANLRRAQLAGANLSGADLSGAILGRADLSGANLAGAILRRANLDGAQVSPSQLSEARGDPRPPRAGP